MNEFNSAVISKERVTLKESELSKKKKKTRLRCVFERFSLFPHFFFVSLFFFAVYLVHLCFVFG
jgi:hypothetical protein